ncbi:hypothetical protein COT98_00820 [Candidatus Falkowbacteria bacterium CG10_big_fil_rev_8_21_14_0_10_39_9]|uniref:Response regulatory domain-containing protein n=1 Tax=Candidatus Falkowbacteria bacterium CG10_big_fil_rev_8_21_14_0_10_39_9 TaxID=1974566 RepID=A0A2M6WQU5_9BACT|nr:MAG: hypothetical protein COT98_00820 [Candidatus Falkowbacteria bacterium CG10_big_fil_rev_8_21_14_0_10_39_9]
MTGKKILIVEDEVSIASALKIKLEREGYLVFLGTNGQEGLDLVLKEVPDLILLDIAMPIMDGITMMKKLRADVVGKTMDILILTNSTRPNDISDILQYGVVDYLLKSQWRLDDLVEKIKTIVK